MIAPNPPCKKQWKTSLAKYDHFHTENKTNTKTKTKEKKLKQMKNNTKKKQHSPLR